MLIQKIYKDFSKNNLSIFNPEIAKEKKLIEDANQTGKKHIKKYMYV